jgi:hypothetical protein
MIQCTRRAASQTGLIEESDPASDDLLRKAPAPEMTGRPARAADDKSGYLSANATLRHCPPFSLCSVTIKFFQVSTRATWPAQITVVLSN